MSNFDDLYLNLIERVMDEGEEVDVGQWQSQDVSNQPHMVSREIRHCTFEMKIPESVEELQELVKPNLPWAEDHFQERVSGEPLNPPPSEAWWPFRVRGNEDHKDNGGQFSHTYPERMWPKHAGEGVVGDKVYDLHYGWIPHHNTGIRFIYGDLMDLVKQLKVNPLTRQAYLPIWFPEDTGAIYNQRVPCTLGYHFLARNGVMDIVYFIRSCDLLRHFQDDVYMAARLLQWVLEQLFKEDVKLKPGLLVMHISSLHVFKGDYDHMNQLLANAEGEEWYGAAI